MKRIFVLIALVLTTFGAYAQHITEQQAIQRALQFMNSGKASAAAGRMAAPCRNGSVKLESAPVEASSIYAFNLEGGGFIIASADSRTLPVLGYSTSGSIDWELLPDNIREWLKSYDEAVASLGNRTDIIDGNLLSDPSQSDTPLQREPVEPLIKTHWDQFAPYWNQTPIYKGSRSDLKGKRTLTGCAATAMAQIVNYYQWPKTIPDGLPEYNASTYYPYTLAVYDYTIDALPPVAFDWDNMLDDYQAWNPETQQTEQVGNEQQRRAVATLMRYCGQSQKMMYGTYELGSGASPSEYPYAFNIIFDYPAALYLERAEYGIDDWEDIIYGELAARRPILYCGYSDDGGHAFVCDGYDGYGLFHINWGWSGSDDGYFALSVLNPYNNTSAGSGSSGIGFSIDQCAVIYTDPTMEIRPKPESSLTDFPVLYQDFGMIVQETNKVVFNYQYDGKDAGQAVADYAFGIPGEDGMWLPRFMGDPNDSIIFPDNNMTLEIDSTVFLPGDSVTLYPLLRFRNEGAQWQVIQPLESHVVTGRTDQGNFFITVHGAKNMIECVNAFISKGTGQLNERSDLTVVLKNNTDWDYQSSLRILPQYYGHIDPENITEETPYSRGDLMECGTYLRAGQEGEVTYSFVPKQGGYTEFLVFKPNGYSLGSFSLELNNDTLADYDPYVENKSYFARKDNQWVYHVELCDRAGAEILPWIPADSLRLTIRFMINNDQVKFIKLFDEINEYLKELPQKGGNGDYKFTYDVPIELSEDGEYYIDSYLFLKTGYDEDDYIFSCTHYYSFRYSNPTGVTPTVIDQADEPYYDLLGRPVEGIPDRKGLYIKGKKKVYIR
ncbi:MAG: C10 family peptidase [Bacteroidaceae bacterium]|nr:C10 family peptidase [Bacteroidaceae bacterium]